MQQPTHPIIIKIAEPPSELDTLGRVLLQSLGLFGTRDLEFHVGSQTWLPKLK